MRFWVNTVSRDHVLRGVEGGFTQANHGAAAGLKRLARGDRIVFYSPRTDYPDGERLQRFTALGEVTDEAPYQAEMSPDFHPWRRNVSFLPSEETEIEPLIEGLSFIKDKKRWGFPFRRGLFEIDEADFRLIAAAMGARLAT
jgi:hypothetical protein